MRLATPYALALEDGSVLLHVKDTASEPVVWLRKRNGDVHALRTTWLALEVIATSGKLPGDARIGLPDEKGATTREEFSKVWADALPSTLVRLHAAHASEVAALDHSKSMADMEHGRAAAAVEAHGKLEHEAEGFLRAVESLLLAHNVADVDKVEGIASLCTARDERPARSIGALLYDLADRMRSAVPS